MRKHGVRPDRRSADIFTWYWLADLGARENTPFVLGHALSMKAIHGGKAKHDRIDAHKIAALLRGGMIPQAFVMANLTLRRGTLVAAKALSPEPAMMSAGTSWAGSLAARVAS